MTATPARTIVALDATLGEHDYYGTLSERVRWVRAIHVDPIAGTLQVRAQPRANGAVFFWKLPRVPLSQVNALSRDLLPLVNQALPGMTLSRLRHPDPDGHRERLELNRQADTLLRQADALVDQFWRRWTGRPLNGGSWAHCQHCGQPIVHGGEKNPGWIGDPLANTTACTATDRRHVPQPLGQLYSTRGDLRPHHHPIYQQESDGTWSGRCICEQWSGSSADSDWLPLVYAYGEHADQLPPGAPFDV